MSYGLPYRPGTWLVDCAIGHHRVYSDQVTYDRWGWLVCREHLDKDGPEDSIVAITESPQAPPFVRIDTTTDVSNNHTEVWGSMGVNMRWGSMQRSIDDTYEWGEM